MRTRVAREKDPVRKAPPAGTSTSLIVTPSPSPWALATAAASACVASEMPSGFAPKSRMSYCAAAARIVLMSRSTARHVQIGMHIRIQAKHNPPHRGGQLQNFRRDAARREGRPRLRARRASTSGDDARLHGIAGPREYASMYVALRPFHGYRGGSRSCTALTARHCPHDR